MRYLKSEGAWVMKVHGSPYQRPGVPDLLVCYRGRFLGLEVKQPGKHLSKLQAHEIDAIHEAGGMAERVESVEDVETIIGGINESADRHQA